MHRNKNTICSTQYAHNMHTICTQYAHKHTHKHNNMQHTEQNIQDNTEQNIEQRTEQHTEHSTENSTYDLHKYSFDLYHEYVTINNSNTIELYTILQDKV